MRAMWHWVGEPRRVPTPGTNGTRAWFGARNIRPGRWVSLVRERMHQEAFLAFLEHLLVAYPQGPIVLIVDHFSSHTAHAVTVWLDAHPRLHWCYVPKCCSPVNPVARIWLRLKNMLAPNRLYGSIQVLLGTVEGFFTAMTPEQALKWAAA